LSKADFVRDETLKRAYVRSLEIMGEAVKQLPDTLRQKYTAIEWRSIAGMRDRLIHRPLAQFELSPSPPAPLPNLGEGSHKRYEDRGSA
jgi:Protein of unknown function DUF86